MPSVEHLRGRISREAYDHIEYISHVLDGKYPEEILVPLDSPFRNENGEIQNLVLGEFTSSAIIHSVDNSIRANHRHRTDWHFSYLVSGEVWYYHRKAGTEEIFKRVFRPGEMFFTPPMVDHAMAFPAASTFVTFSRNLREKSFHEEDVERIKMIGKEVFHK